MAVRRTHCRSCGRYVSPHDRDVNNYCTWCGETWTKGVNTVIQRTNIVQEDAVESEAAACPCCGEALVVEVNVGALPDGSLHLNSFAVAHLETPEGQALQQRLDRAPKRKG